MTGYIASQFFMVSKNMTNYIVAAMIVVLAISNDL